MASLNDLLPKYLYSERLTLERFNHSEQHCECLLSVMNSATAHITLGDFGIRTSEQFDALNRPARLKGTQFTNGVADDDLYYLLRLGAQSPDGELIGGVSLCQRSTGDLYLPPDLGWGIVESHMRQGYATEAARELLRWIREDFSMEEVVVLPGAHNPASIRVAEKLGFVEGGQIPDYDAGKTYSIFVLPGMQRYEFAEGVSLSMNHR